MVRYVKGGLTKILMRCARSVGCYVHRARTVYIADVNTQFAAVQ